MTDPYLIPMASKLDINVEIRPKSPDVNLVRLNDINLERHKKEACVISIFYSVGMPNATGCHYSHSGTFNRDLPLDDHIPVSDLQ